MAIDTTSQFSLLDRLGALLGLGDNGERGNIQTGMTVPTALNTSDSWVPTGTVQQPGTQGLGTGLGLNVGTGQLALQGLGSLAGIFSSMKQNRLAQDQFNFQKDFANTNLNNQIKSYNTTLEDRLTSRGAVEGRSAEYTADEIARRRLSR